jgi:hypothetical protein
MIRCKIEPLKTTFSGTVYIASVQRKGRFFTRWYEIGRFHSIIAAEGALREYLRPEPSTYEYTFIDGTLIDTPSNS